MQQARASRDGVLGSRSFIVKSKWAFCESDVSADEFLSVACGLLCVDLEVTTVLREGKDSIDSSPLMSPKI